MMLPAALLLDAVLGVVLYWVVPAPASRHMEVALKRTYDATPELRLVVATGDGA